MNRREITFEQSEGAQPLPSQLALRQLSPELRALMWDVIYSNLIANRVVRYQKYCIGGWLFEVLKDYWVRRLHKMADEFDDNFSTAVVFAKQITVNGTYVKAFGFLEFVIRHPDCPEDFADAMDEALSDGRSAYRILDRDTIVPIVTEAEGEVIKSAFSDLDNESLGGARAHLRNAASELVNGNWGGAIRESVHAVEAVARTLEPSATTLDPALARLEKAGHIHTALRQGFGKLYGFTNDEKGIRHALLDKSEADVDEVDAIYMFGSCAAFVSYLIGKARRAEIII